MSHPIAKQRVQRWALLRTSSFLGDSTRIRLHPLRIESLDDGYSVTRTDTGSVISTGSAGVECIERLRRGESLGETRDAVGLEHQCLREDVDVMPLLDCLVEADFIESIDGYPVSAARPTRVDKLKLVLAASLWAPLFTMAARWLPLRPLLRLAHQRWRGRNRRMLRLIAAHMGLLPGIRASPTELAALARSNHDVLSAQYVDRLLLALLPPTRLHRWLKDHARIAGLEHFDRSLAQGRGVLLCAYHTGSYSLTPFILAAQGYELVVLSGMDDPGEASLERRLQESRAAGYDYHIESVRGPLRARSLLRVLRGGQAALLLCDAAPTDGRHPLEVEYLGGRLLAERGPGWLAWRTGAALLVGSEYLIWVQ